MKQPKKQVILTNWDIYFDNACYPADFYNLLVKFIHHKRFLKIPANYSVHIVGYVICNSNGKAEKDIIQTPPIISIKKISYRRFKQKTDFWWWETAKAKRIFCAKASDGSIYYFRPRFASTNLKNCLNYIVSGK